MIRSRGPAAARRVIVTIILTVPLLLWGCAAGDLLMSVLGLASSSDCFGSADSPLDLPADGDIRAIAERFCQSKGYERPTGYDEKDGRILFICCSR